MAYVADPTNPSQPTEDINLSTAAAEFRALKGYVRDDLLQPIQVMRAETLAARDATAADKDLVATLTAGSLAAVNYKGPWSLLTGALTIPSSVSHAGSLWVLQADLADVTAAVPEVGSAAWVKSIVAADGVALEGPPVGMVATNVQLAVAELNTAVRKVAAPNLFVNGNFRGNTRALTGTIALAASTRAHDMWRSGGIGCTYSVSGGVATVTAGGLQAIIAGGDVETTGEYTISHSGTAQITVGGALPASSPLTVTLVAGQNAFIEFGPGTIDRVQVEKGNKATPYYGYLASEQHARLSYFVNKALGITGNSVWTLFSTGFGHIEAYREIRAPAMYAVPTMTVTNNSAVEAYANGSAWLSAALALGVRGTPDAPIGLLIINMGGSGQDYGKNYLVRRTLAGDMLCIFSAEPPAA